MAGHPESDGSPRAPLRLSPTMVSRKLLTLNFIERYIGEWGGSPSLSEIAAGTATNRQRALDAVRKLTREGRILRRPGPRGISLPPRPPPGDPETVTQSSLPLIPELDHPPAQGSEERAWRIERRASQERGLRAG